MKIYNEPKGETKQLPCSVNGLYLTEYLLLNSRARWAKKGIFELACEQCELIEKYKLTPEIVINDNIATFDLTEAETYLVDNDNWHTPTKLTAKMGDLEGHTACIFYWFRMKFPETTGATDPILKAFFDRAVLLNLAPYLAKKNGGSEYYLYLSYIMVSDGFTVDENGKVIASEQLKGIPIEQLAPAKIEDGKIVLA